MPRRVSRGFPQGPTAECSDRGWMFALRHLGVPVDARQVSIRELRRLDASVVARSGDARRLDGSVVAPFVDEDVDYACVGAGDVEVDASFPYEAVHRIHEEPAFTDVVTLFARLRDDSVNVGPHYAGDDPRFRSVAHLEQDVDGLFTEVDAVSLNVVVVEVHVGSLYACEAADDGVVEDTEIPVVTDYVFVDANDVPVEADKTEGVTDESRVVADRTFVDANDVPVEVDILSVATTDTGEGTNKTGVATTDTGEETNKTDVATTDTGEGTNKTDLATHVVRVVTDSIKEGTAKICVETTNPSLETTRVCPVTAPLWVEAPQIRVGSASLLVATTRTGVDAKGTRVATVEPL